MNELKQKFVIHPVGQGLFYSGIVSYESSNNVNKTFRFVFDCGSIKANACKNEVDNFKTHDFPDFESLDLLIISHFDCDHVNQIGHLLEGRKVKKIIAPFLNFDERFFILLRAIENNDISVLTQENLNVVSLILNPIETLQEYLSEGGNILLLKSGDGPFEPQPDNEIPLSELGENSTFELEFDNNSNELNQNEIGDFKISDSSRVKMLSDSNKSKLSIGKTPIMEFLFYRKNIGPDESLFSQNVLTEFYNRYPNDFANLNYPTFEEIIHVLINKVNAKDIKDIFAKAFNNTPNLTIKKSDLLNLNTTSLNMMCVNYKYIYNWKNNVANIFHQIHRLQKFDGDKPIPLYFEGTRTYWRSKNYFGGRRSDHFPNIFLTSDSFYLEDSDINELYDRFKNYWREYWLFQIPHHGSQNNINHALLSRIPFNVSKFINYGTKNRDKHPSSKVIEALIVTDHANNLFPINEFQGLQFELIIEH